MKVCLVYPNTMKFPLRSFKRVAGVQPSSFSYLPLGMLYIISNTRYKIDFINNCICRYSDKRLYHILKSYDVVGFGGTVYECLQAKKVSSLLRNNGTLTIYGGPNATVNWQKYIDFFDIIVKGEGEITVDEVLDCVENNRSLRDIEGIVFKENGNIINNPDRPFIQNLDKLNYPAREILDLKKYQRHARPYLDVYPVDTVVSSRGCPFACTFCSSKYFWKRIYRARLPEEVVKEIKYLINRFGTKGIFFNEDLFTVSKERVLQFCRLVKPLGIVWACEAKVGTVDEEMLKAMKESGCKAMLFGLESCSNKTLKLINKKITVEQSQETIKLCKKFDIYTHAWFMIGLPHETKEDMLYTIKTSKTWQIDHIDYSRVCAIPKSELYDLVKRKNLDRYEYNDVILPDTEYVSADGVSRICSKAFNWETRLWYKIPLFIREYIRRYDKLYGKLHKWAKDKNIR